VSLRCYFDIRDRRGLVPDEEGILFETVHSGLIEAWATAQDIRRQRARTEMDCLADSVRIEMRDEVGNLVVIIPLLETFKQPNASTTAANDLSPKVIGFR
jgi:hypothetical protein